MKQNVIGGRNKDTVVDVITVYSDPLLIRLSKRHIPEYNDNKHVTIDKTEKVDITVSKQVDYSKLDPEQLDMVRKLLTKPEPEEIEDAIIIENDAEDDQDPDQMGLF